MERSILKVHLPNGGFNMVKYGDATDVKVRLCNFYFKVWFYLNYLFITLETILCVFLFLVWFPVLPWISSCKPRGDNTLVTLLMRPIGTCGILVGTQCHLIDVKQYKTSWTICKTLNSRQFLETYRCTDVLV